MSAFEWRDAPAGPAYAVIGDPVGHSLSPAMQNAAFEALGMTDRYVAVRVPEAEFGPALTRLAATGFRGLNVTVPLKRAALLWADRPDALSMRIGVANTLNLIERSATNTDSPGFAVALAELSPRAGSTAVLLGAGGAARAVAVALADAGFALRIYNRTASRAERLLRELGLQGEVLDAPSARDAGVVVNATSAGVRGEALWVEWEGCEPDAVAMDLAYGPAAEPFVGQARRLGLRACDGKAMLVAQGALAFEWWTGIPAPREVMLRAIP